MLEDALASLFASAPTAGVAIVFAWQLWKRTAATLDHYERTLDQYNGEIFRALQALQQEIAQCPKRTDNTPNSLN